MKKYIISVFIFVMLMLSLSGISVYAEQLYYNDAYHYYDGGNINLSVNGKAVNNLPMKPVIIDDRTMVPVREVFEALGSAVLWHDDTCQVEISNNGVSVLIKIGDRNTYVNGEIQKIADDQPLPMLIGYEPSMLKSMVPVRFVAEKIGYNVLWDEASRTVNISKKVSNVVTQLEPPTDKVYGSFGKVTPIVDGKYDCIYISTYYGISPVISRYSNPERVVFDFPGAQFKNIANSGDSVDVYGNCIDRVRYSNYNGQARVVFDVSKPAQVAVMSSSAGILLRAEHSENTQIMYDAFARKIYFNGEYHGTGKPVENGYEVEFKNLNMKSQKIEIHDGIVYEIIITGQNKGCKVKADGSNDFSYSDSTGIVRAKEKPNKKPSQGYVEGAKLVVLDAGHGGYDPGAVGKDKDGKDVAHESDINLAIVKLIKSKLEANGISVILTRTNDSFVTLADRAKTENESGCNVFVSIHCNSIENTEIQGTQVYYHPQSTAGTILANNIYNEMVEITGLEPKRVQNGANLYVIRTTKSPAVLVETAFISNESDRNYLTSKEGQNKIAEAVTQGIIKSLGEI